MFTGIVTHTGTITDVIRQGDVRVTIACPFAGDLRIGDSVAVNGCCLTVVEIVPPPAGRRLGGGHMDTNVSTMPPPQPSPYGGGSFTADLSEETLSRTSPRWKKNEQVNLERSLKLGDSLDGHMVTGHVDGTAIIVEIIPPPAGGRLGGGHMDTNAPTMPPPQPSPYGGGSRTLILDTPATLARFIAAKGSVTLDGISLTVNKVEANRFWVNIIPHTWQATTLKGRKTGEALNLEIDLMARYAERLLRA